MELVNEWLPTGKFRNFDTPFSTDSAYEKELLAAIILTEHALNNQAKEYHGNFGHTYGRIQHIALMIRVYRCYATCRYMENLEIHLERYNIFLL